SFQMDLYQPLFIPRPSVEPERFASLRPPTYNGAMAVNPAGAGMAGVGGIGGIGGIGGGLGGLGRHLPGGLHPVVDAYQMMNGNIGNLGQFGQQGGLGLQFGQQGGQGNNDNNFSNNSLNPRLNYDQLQQRRKERQEALAKAKAIGSSVATLDPAGGVSSIA